MKYFSKFKLEYSNLFIYLYGIHKNSMVKLLFQ